jgi:hypothetical protein
MDMNDWTMLVTGLSLAVVGAYIMARPRRLFMFEEDRAEYRPGTVEHDSEHGRWLRKAAPLYLVAGLALIGLSVL